MFSNRAGKPLKTFRAAGLNALDATKISGLRFHDLRGEYASRLVERGVPLSQVRDLLGHASIVTTERYDRQRFEMLEVAAKKLETGETFNIPSSCPDSGMGTIEDTLSPKALSHRPYSSSLVPEVGIEPTLTVK